MTDGLKAVKLFVVSSAEYVTYLFLSLYPQGHDGVVTLCRYPFVFDAQAKTTLLQTDAVIQMQVIYSGSFEGYFFLHLLRLPFRLPFLHLRCCKII